MWEHIEDAWRVFNKMPSWDVVTWTTIMLGYLKCGQGQRLLELFWQMNQEGVQPNLLPLCECWMHNVPVFLHLKREDVLMSRLFILDGIWMSLWGVLWLTCMQNVGAWRMLGECSKCHLEMWPLGMPYLEHVPYMGIIRNLLNIFIGHVSLHSQD
jgi:pentatricopeptide repeat protein